MHFIVRARWIGVAMIEADLAPDLSGGDGAPRIVVAAPDADGRNGDRRWISHLEHLALFHALDATWFTTRH